MGEKWPMNFALRMPHFHITFRDLLHAVNLRHGTDGFTSPPKEGVLWIFSPQKNPTASVGFEPANLGTKSQDATSRPPNPLRTFLIMHMQCEGKYFDGRFFTWLIAYFVVREFKRRT